MMPPVGVLIPIYLLFKTLGLLDTVTGLLIIYTLINLPIVVWMLYTYFKDVPGEILEAGRVDGANVVWRRKSSNSLRLVEVAERSGCSLAVLVERADQLPWDKLQGIQSVGVTAGASAPEIIVSEVIEAFKERYDVTIDIVSTAEERVVFNVPRELRTRASVNS